MSYTPEQLAAKNAQCDCALRSFFQGPCEWCTAHPEELPPLDYQQFARAALIRVQEMLDPIVTQAAIELGHRAGEELAKLAPPADIDPEYVEAVGVAMEHRSTDNETIRNVLLANESVRRERMGKIEWADKHSQPTEVNGVTWVNQGKAGDQR